MGFRRPRISLIVLSLLGLGGCAINASAFAQDSSSSANSHARAAQRRPAAIPSLDAGSVSAGAYRNPSFGFTCRVPEGWVLRTEEMNARGEEDASAQPAKDSGKIGRVLLSAAESAVSYAGLKEPAQYFGPVTEVAKAQGFEIDGEPYGFVLGTKTLVRGDFEKNVGTRVIRQSTLVMLAHGYVVSLTFIGGTDDEVEELVQGLSFAVTTKPAR